MKGLRIGVLDLNKNQFKTLVSGMFKGLKAYWLKRKLSKKKQLSEQEREAIIRRLKELAGLHEQGLLPTARYHMLRDELFFYLTAQDRAAIEEEAMDDGELEVKEVVEVVE